MVREVLDRRKVRGRKVRGHGAHSRFLLLSSRYTGGTLRSVSLVSDPSLVNTTFTSTPTLFHGGNTGSNLVGDANRTLFFRGTKRGRTTLFRLFVFLCV